MYDGFSGVELEYDWNLGDFRRKTRSMVGKSEENGFDTWKMLGKHRKINNSSKLQFYGYTQWFSLAVSLKMGRYQRLHDHRTRKTVTSIGIVKPQFCWLNSTRHVPSSATLRPLLGLLMANLELHRYPLVICYIAIENCPFIVDLPIKDCDFP